MTAGSPVQGWSGEDPGWTVVVDEALHFLGDRLRSDEPLAPLCTYRVGGAARRFVEVRDAEELAMVVAALAGAALGGRAAVVGRGSNLLVADRGFDGVVIRLGEHFAKVEVAGTGVVSGAAASLPVVARRTVAEGLSGFEWAVGVPGSMGGAVVMNAGGHGSDMRAVVSGVRVHDLLSGETRDMPSSELDFAYRHSAIGPHQIVSRVELALEPGERERGEQLLSEIVRWRRENQPGGPNAGSVFTNPPGDSAGRLIDEAGCKGLRVGTAEVSAKHANFIQADRDGSADDVLALMDEVVERVRQASGVTLQAETRLLGFAR
ncbi:MAG: UDP-N-acetylmuramate dehydrogenase [Microthrixaceae bacterium]|nr:UDP-N-acetylmuramate dehydrogenase [Microthrixaceae bacterium]MCO5321421.1 UDP-N-acetylmuramate dehydrogenase [Microthrixaceae bacterium]